MKRREFALCMGMAPMIAAPARAAIEPSEGKHYTRLSPPVPVAVAGKVEVIEFFGYWCPHCNTLEPLLAPWAKKLPADVNFRRIPVAWQAMQVAYQNLYFALEAMGLPAEIHGKVFQAVHGQGLRLDNDAGLSAFVAANGLDKAKLVDVMKGFTVSSKVRVANQAWTAYRFDGVPKLAVNGRYATSPEQAGGNAQVLEVIDALIVKARAGG